MNAEKEYKEHVVSKIVLDEMRIRLHKRVGKYTFRSINVNVLAGSIVDEAVFEVTMKILGQSNIRKYEVLYEFPKNWWEHLKHQYFPDWLLKKFPVKVKVHTRTVEFDHKALVPKWDQFPKGQEVVMFSQPVSPDVKESK
jgi:hypothetical protein